MNARTISIEVTSRGFLAGPSRAEAMQGEPQGEGDPAVAREPLDLRIETLKAWLEPCDDLDRVIFTGPGEPLLHPRIAYLVRTARAYGALCVVETGARVLEGRLVRDLIEAGLDELWIRLDAPGREANRALRHEDTYDRVLANLIALRDEKKMLLIGNPAVVLRLRSPLPSQPLRLAERVGASVAAATRAPGPFVAVTGQVFGWGPSANARDLADLPLLGEVADRPLTAWKLPEPPVDAPIEVPVDVPDEVPVDDPVEVLVAPPVEVLVAPPVEAAPAVPVEAPIEPAEGVPSTEEDPA